MSAEHPVDIDELKLAWRALDRRLERQHALELASFERARMLDVRRAMRPLVAGQVAQALLGALLIVCFASFWSEHRAALHLVVLGVLGQLWAMALTGFAAADLIAVSGIDYAEPVLAIQKRLAGLRARRIRATPFFVVTGCVMWIPVTLVVFRQLGGAQLWADAPEVAAWLAGAEQPQALLWLIGNVVVVPTLALLAVRWLRDPRRAWLARRIDNQLAGRSVLRAESMLAEIAEFERG